MRLRKYGLRALVAAGILAAWIGISAGASLWVVQPNGAILNVYTGQILLPQYGGSYVDPYSGTPYLPQEGGLLPITPNGRTAPIPPASGLFGPSPIPGGLCAFTGNCE